MTTSTVETVDIYETPNVEQPKQHGKPGGLVRHCNFVTAVILGVVLAALAYWISGMFTTGETLNANYVPIGIDVQITAMYIGWVVGFMIGIGAFIGPIRWFLARAASRCGSVSRSTARRPFRLTRKVSPPSDGISLR